MMNTDLVAEQLIELACYRHSTELIEMLSNLRVHAGHAGTTDIADVLAAVIQRMANRDPDTEVTKTIRNSRTAAVKSAGKLARNIVDSGINHPDAYPELIARAPESQLWAAVQIIVTTAGRLEREKPLS